MSHVHYCILVLIRIYYFYFLLALLFLLLFLFCCSILLPCLALLPCCSQSLLYCSLLSYIHYRASLFLCLAPFEVTPCYFQITPYFSHVSPCYSRILLFIALLHYAPYSSHIAPCYFHVLLLVALLHLTNAPYFSHIAPYYSHCFATHVVLLFAPCQFCYLVVCALLLLKLHLATHALLPCHHYPTITPCCSPFLSTSYPPPIVVSLHWCSLSHLATMPCQLVLPLRFLVQVEELGTTPTIVIQQWKYLFFQIS